MSKKLILVVMILLSLFGGMVNLGLPLGIQSIIAKARQNKRLIALNGCEMECASKTLQAVSIMPEKAILLTVDSDLKKQKFR